jgi:uncharacterized protein DUF2637
MRTAARMLVVLVGIAAMVLSFHHLIDLAIRAGVPVALAPLYPLMVDVLTIVAYLRMASAVRGSHEWHSSVALLAGSLAISVIGNVAAGITGDLPWIVPFIVAGLPPLFLFVVAHQALGVGAAAPETTSAVTHVPAYVPQPAAPPVGCLDGSEPVDAFADVDDPVAALVGAFTRCGGEVSDPLLTKTVASALVIDERSARRRLQPYREADG